MTARVASGSPPAPRHSAPPGAEEVLPRFFDALFEELGPQKWWPARSPFEVIVGAILTQNTAWTNVEKALGALRRARLLTPLAMGRTSTPTLARLVRPSGYFRQKARKLKAFVHFLRRGYGGSLARMFAQPTANLRAQLLTVYGIGPETADSILLYAGSHPAFVVDAYTKRITTRHGLTTEAAGYHEVQSLFERALPRDARVFNEYHALLVHVGKNWCRPRDPLCDACPLGKFL